MKKSILLLALLLVINFGFSQTKLAKLTFETDPTDTDPAITDISYTTSKTEGSDYTIYSGGGTHRPQHFIRTTNVDAAPGSVNYNSTGNLGDYYFAAMDLNGNKNNIDTVYLEQINISGYENIEIRVYLAGMPTVSNRGWDNNFEETESFIDSSTGLTDFGSGQNDYVHFDYDIDVSGTFSPAIWVESDADKYDDSSNDNKDARIDTDFDGTGDGTLLTDTFVQFTGDISGTGDVIDIVIDFRINGVGEDIAIDNIEIWGTLINDTCSGTNVTWDGTSWSATPDITTPVVINGAYTANATNGSFSACSLTLNDDLTIDSGYYIEVEHDVTINIGSTLKVENDGAFVQNVDTATFTNSGTSIVRKNTDVLNNWYDYTYWSSPVSDLTIGTSPLASSDRHYWYDATKYVDVLKETANTNTFTTGSDDIDDDGNDWQWAADATPMTPGVGFAATHSQVGYIGASTYEYDFYGEFNNGPITVPIDYDAGNTGGHWNLIGNPYPCALDFDAFITNNSNVVEGAAYLWSQSTDYSATAGGSEANNFSTADYIIINTGSGSVNNSPGTLLEYIPTGQSFFIAGLANGTVTFNNSMRIKNGSSNGQFFKNSKTKKKSTSKPNKLWVNLTSDIGVFNQALIAYVDGASDNYDGMSYDAPRNLSSGVASIIYTLIDDVSNKKFAIQGKSTSSINEDEVIPLGFFTSTENATLYTFSIEHLQGEFMSSNSIYLKDNLLDTINDLSSGDYSFTSDTGEFNNRFEIVFKNKVLAGTDDELGNNSLQIINLKNKRVNFKATNGLTIKNVTIYDLFGRKLYDFKGENNSEIYSLTNLGHAAYIARIELSNNAAVIKKFINF